MDMERTLGPVRVAVSGRGLLAATRQELALVAAVATLTVALFLNLDVHHLFIHTDEPRRALVALEMMLSGNYVVPTLNGEAYFNKPPLFNWLLAVSFGFWGEESEWAIRFPVVISVIGFALSIYHYSRRYLEHRIAVITALTFVTSGRILFYDSFLGLLDITYAWMLFLSVMGLFTGLENNRILRAFVIAYLWAAAAYLMKGLPGLVFTGLAVVAWLGVEKRFRLLFSRQHLIGIAAFTIVVGTYYAAYAAVSDVPVATLFSTLWEESAKRTVIEFGWLSVLGHLVVFPFAMVMHFLPWSLLGLLLLRRANLEQLWRQRFLRFCVVVFIANIGVYWSSPEVYPRYLFPFVPLWSAVCVSLYFWSDERDWRRRTINAGLLVLVGAAIGVALYAPFDWRVQGLGGLYTKAAGVVMGLLVAFTLGWRQRRQLLPAVILAFAVVRVGFDLFNLPIRDPDGFTLKAQALQVAAMTRGQPLFLYRNSQTHDGTTFYITRERGQILRRTETLKRYPAWYIVRQELIDGFPRRQVHYQFRTRSYNKPLYLVRTDGV